jgi:hypothetical protein
MPERETAVADVSGLRLGDLLKLDDAAVSASVETVLKQVAKPRRNLGGAGPPGRAD